MSGAFTIGGIVANLGARHDDAAFDRWERRVTTARRSAADDVEIKLKGDAQDTGFLRWDQRVERTRREARNDVEIKLKGDHDETGFRKWFGRVDKARADARNKIEAKLGTDVDTRGFDRYEDRLNGVDDAHNNLVGGTTRVRGAMGSLFIGGAGVAGATIAFGALALGAKKSVDAFEESEVIARRQALVIRTMGQDAGVTAEEMNTLAAAEQRKTGIDDDLIISGGNVVRTFRNIRDEAGAGNDVFTRTTKASFDLAAAMGTDASNAAIMLGKALNDPTKGAAALGRTGAIAKGDLEELKKMAEDGAPLLEQQRFILEKVEEQFKGSAEAAATASGKMKASIGEMAEDIGEKVAPTFNRVVGSVRDFIDELRTGTGAGGRFGDRMRSVASVVSRAYSSVRDVVGDVFGFIDRAIDENADTLGTMGRSVEGLERTVGSALGELRDAFRSVFGGNSGTSRDLRDFIRAVLDVADAALKVLDAIARRALPGISTAFRGFFQVVRGVVRLITGLLTGDFGKAWQGVEDIFAGGVKAIVGTIRAATAPLRTAAAAVGKVIAGAFSGAWNGIVDTAEGFVNKIIDVINIIPGVNIKHVGGGDSKPAKTTSDGNARAGTGRPGNFARGGAFGMTGGYIDEPIAVMGEEAPDHNEWVIPENPRYRDRAIGLWMAAGNRLGVPGFAQGGRFSVGEMSALANSVGAKDPRVMGAIGMAESSGDPSANGPPDGRGLWQIEWPVWARTMMARGLNNAYDPGQNARMMKVVQDVQGLKAWVVYNTGAYKQFLGGDGGVLGKIKGAVRGAIGTVRDFVGDLLPKLPKSPGGIIGGAFKYAIDKAKAFIADKAKGVLGIGGGAGGGNGTGVVSGTAAKAAQLAREFSARITSGYRTPAQNAAANGAAGSSHMKGSPSNPGAHDFVPPSAGLLRRALAMGAKWVDNHDYGSGLHSHVSWFRTGGAFGAGSTGGRKIKPRGKTAKPSKPATINAGVRRSVARGELGIAGYESTIQDLERDYDQADRRFGLSDEVLLIENEDGSTTVDTGAVQQRLAELEGLRKRREAIKKKIEEYRRAIGRLIRTLTTAIGKLKKALKAAGGKSRAKERAGYREAIQTYTDRIGELRGARKDLGGDVEDQRIDLAELANEYEAVKSTASTPAEPADDTGTPDTGGFVDTSDAIDPAAQAAEVAAQARAQFESFQAARADLFRDFGSNNVRVGVNPYDSATAQAAGAQYFGAAAGGTVAPDARAFATAGGSVNYIENATFENHYPATPPDGGSHIQQQAREARLAFG